MKLIKGIALFISGMFILTIQSPFILIGTVYYIIKDGVAFGIKSMENVQCKVQEILEPLINEIGKEMEKEKEEEHRLIGFRP